MNTSRIPVYQSSLGGNELKYVTDCIQSTWISSKGKYVAQFEEEFSKYIGIKHSTAVSNGTVAIHLALAALGIGPGDEVIVPTLTYVASVNAIVYTGATPVFVDSIADTWQMDVNDVKRKITSRTKAIMAVHLYGHPCEMDALQLIAEENNIFLIEDCAEAFGTYFKGKHVGTFGDISTFSFYGNKTITTGEGGMVVTNDTKLYERACNLKSQGVAKYKEYWHDVIGYNYRMTNICAAIGLAQLEQADVFIEKKRNLAQWYKEGLQGLPITFHNESKDSIHSYWMCSILVDVCDLRDKLRSYLNENNIETRPLFYPAHTMPIYNTKYEKHPVAEDIGSRGINLPSWPGLMHEQVDYICNCIKNFYAKEYKSEAAGTVSE